MSQQLRARFFFLAEDLNLVSNGHIGWITTACNTSLRAYDAFFLIM